MALRKLSILAPICVGAIVLTLIVTGRSTAMTRAASALRMANDLGIAHTTDPKTLYGLFPHTFPGAYDGTLDVSQYDQEATIEHVVVALVRWAGWDTVHYDKRLIGVVRPFVTPEGFPYYKPDPTPRSIPYMIVALQKGLITQEILSKLRTPVTAGEVDRLCERAKQAVVSRRIVPALILDGAGLTHVNEAKDNPNQLVIVPTGFSRYDVLRDLPNRILDLNAPSLRIYNTGSSLSTGRQDYFPLGPLESQFSVGMKVSADSYSHQAESIYGSIENDSTTVNAVGIWGRAASLRKDARVWGGFLVAETHDGANNDAQVIGLEVDTVNTALPGVAPNRSKTGIQVVGIGTQPLTNGIEIIGAGPAKWSNGILFEPGSIHSDGAILGSSDRGEISRGIDFSQTHFRDSAFLLSQGSRITFRNVTGGPSMLHTDAFGQGHFVIRAGVDGLRVTSNDDTKNLAYIDKSGNITTPRGNFDQVLTDIKDLKEKRVVLSAAPKTSRDRCRPGAWASDVNYVYVCVAENTWRRAQLSAW